MDIPEFQKYYALGFSGMTQKYANFYGPKRLYAHGLKYGTTRNDAIALFDFVWIYQFADNDKFMIIRNMPFNCPLQHLTIKYKIDSESFEIDYESFTSLN